MTHTLKFDNSNGCEIDGVFIRLTTKESDVLRALAKHKGLVQSKGSLLTSIYQGMDEPVDKIIDVFVCKVRTKMMKAGFPGMIKTIWGRGYMLNADCKVEWNRPSMTVHLSPETHKRLEDLIFASSRPREDVIEIIFNRGMKIYEDAIWEI